MGPKTFIIDLNEQPVQILAKAPIAEAVIEIRAQASSPWEESAVRESLESQMSGYVYFGSRQEWHAEWKIRDQSVNSELNWKGLRFRSEDETQIAQFNCDGFVFSRLHPYQSWNQLYSEAMRLWTIHAELANPENIKRLGVRFINRFGIPAGESVETLLSIPPSPPVGLNLDYVSFMYQDRVVTPGYPYTINIIRALQGSLEGSDTNIILDIDVFTTTELLLTKEVFDEHLPKMRWLKNKVFSSSITQRALEIFR